MNLVSELNPNFGTVFSDEILALDAEINGYDLSVGPGGGYRKCFVSQYGWTPIDEIAGEMTILEPSSEAEEIEDEVDDLIAVLSAKQRAETHLALMSLDIVHSVDVDTHTNADPIDGESWKNDEDVHPINEGIRKAAAIRHYEHSGVKDSRWHIRTDCDHGRKRYSSYTGSHGWRGRKPRQHRDW